ncbi:MAG: hypothetical protein ABUK01_07250 [Leptospirales bacterium]
MVSENYQAPVNGYRIKLIVAIEKDNQFTYKNELVVPILYDNLEKAQGDIEKDISARLNQSLYFRSAKTGYDLVLYSHMASLNTYLAYRIVPVLSQTPVKTENSSLW